MTTIAYRSGVLAADRRSTSASRITYDSEQKLILDPEDPFAVYAFTGPLHAGLAAVYAIMANGDASLTKGDEAPEVIELRSIDGVRFSMTLYESGHPVEYEDPGIMAFGGGAAAAHGAMLAGVGAAEAIEIAAQIHSSTGGGVDVAEFDPQTRGFVVTRL